MDVDLIRLELLRLVLGRTFIEGAQLAEVDRLLAIVQPPKPDGAAKPGRPAKGR